MFFEPKSSKFAKNLSLLLKLADLGHGRDLLVRLGLLDSPLLSNLGLERVALSFAVFVLPPDELEQLVELSSEEQKLADLFVHLVLKKEVEGEEAGQLALKMHFLVVGIK